MANRVTATDVQRIVDFDDSISMVPFIEDANALTDKVSDNDAGNLLNAALLKGIERRLAAHFYSLRDPLYKRKITGKSEGEFESRSHFDEAKLLDITGYLASLGKNHRVGMAWLGLPPSEQTDYLDRD